MSYRTREYNFGWIFWIAAAIILITVYDVQWWAAFLITLLAQVELKFSQS